MLAKEEGWNNKLLGLRQTSARVCAGLCLQQRVLTVKRVKHIHTVETLFLGTHFETILVKRRFLSFLLKKITYMLIMKTNIYDIPIIVPTKIWPR